MIKMNRYIILSGIILLFGTGVNAQNIEKAMINKGCLYSIHKIYQEFFMGNYHKYYSAFLERNCDITKENPLTYTWLYSDYYFPKMQYPYCWDIFNNDVYPISAPHGTGIHFSVFKLDIIKKDTATFLEEQKRFYDSLRQIYTTEEEFKTYKYNVLWKRKSKQRNGRSIPVIYKLMDMLKGDYNDFSIKPGMICYDFCVLDTSKMEFYVRGIKQFTKWLYHYPPNHKDPSKPENWEELITYSADTLGSYPYLDENLWILHFPDTLKDDPRAQKKFRRLYKLPDEPYTDKNYVPSGHHHQYEAIDDSLFFEGHFKIVPQGKERFVINTQHGAIYWLGQQAIQKVGQIQMDQYLSLNNKKLYIEDMDNNQIILFAPVEWKNNNLPKPKVKVMNKQLIQEKFQYILK